MFSSSVELCCLGRSSTDPILYPLCNHPLGQRGCIVEVRVIFARPVFATLFATIPCVRGVASVRIIYVLICFLYVFYMCFIFSICVYMFLNVFICVLYVFYVFMCVLYVYICFLYIRIR